MKKVRVLVLRAAGSNCDQETAFAFRAVGAEADLVHVNRVVSGQLSLHDYHILAIPGGFTYGDDVSAGKILANELKYKLGLALVEFHRQGKLIIGICNGFQVLAKAGLLPEVDLGAPQRVTLTNNDSGKFEDRWVYLRINSGPCVFTADGPERIYLPVAHAEGKFVAASKELIQGLQNNGQVVLQYIHPEGAPCTYPWNPNGSVAGIAGICDPSGRVCGLMPHPERHFDPTHHPRWTREGLRSEGDGVFIFRNAVSYVAGNLL
ncbi:MAG: phosphoribosylformylglycinamidine synthase I [bacterium]|jgi:phosphoribosylformylglycinamidine synthase|nr:phosphoribosylformylglycinamidine synthase I [candidate division KSB1 bacterium]MDH7560775.1 phosphoribosylformylglycinamidine synthase I [bacterium]